MKLDLHISPCPNDTFMFEAMLHGRVDTEGLEFNLHLADIEQLNTIARLHQTDICKISYAVLPEIAGRYGVLRSGSAMGRGNGPLLVCRQKSSQKRSPKNSPDKSSENNSGSSSCKVS